VGNTISFAGYNWSVKEYSWRVGPGPNYFTADVADVFVDGNDHLHLNIIKKGPDWYCSEVIADSSPGHGTYVFTAKTDLDSFDENIIVGMFLWDTSAPQYTYREFDFEFSLWGNPAEPNNSQFVIQPWDTPGNLHRFNIDYPAGSRPTTHTLTWDPNHLYFKSYYGNFALAPPEEDIIESWTYNGGDLNPDGAENARINFYLRNGLYPVDNLDDEIIITDYQYLTDISDQPGDIDNDGDVNLKDHAGLANEWMRTDCDAFNNWCNKADLTGDGNVDMADMEALIRYW